MERALFPARARQLERDVHDVAICTMLHAQAPFRSERARTAWLKDANRKMQASDFPTRLAEAQRHIHAQLLRTLISTTSPEGMRASAGFSVEVAPSSVAGAQRASGVFVRGGDAPCGSVVAIYPGTAYGVEHFHSFVAAAKRAPRTQAGAEQEEESESVVSSMRRYDGTVLDGILPPSCSSESALAVGHLVNHPSAGARANVVPCAFDFHFSAPHSDDRGEDAAVEEEAAARPAQVEDDELLLPSTLQALIPCAPFDASGGGENGGEDDSIAARGARFVALLTQRAERVAAERSGAVVVPGIVLITLAGECLLCTVTFHTNLAHSLTRSP